jgi:hypothetical protein
VSWCSAPGAPSAGSRRSTPCTRCRPRAGVRRGWRRPPRPSRLLSWSRLHFRTRWGRWSHRPDLTTRRGRRGQPRRRSCPPWEQFVKPFGVSVVVVQVVLHAQHALVTAPVAHCENGTYSSEPRPLAQRVAQDPWGESTAAATPRAPPLGRTPVFCPLMHGGARHVRSIRRCSSTAAPRRSGRGPVPSPPASSSPRRSGGRPYRRARSTTWSRQHSARTGVPRRAS